MQIIHQREYNHSVKMWISISDLSRVCWIIYDVDLQIFSIKYFPLLCLFHRLCLFCSHTLSHHRKLVFCRRKRRATTPRLDQRALSMSRINLHLNAEKYFMSRALEEEKKIQSNVKKNIKVEKNLREKNRIENQCENWIQREFNIGCEWFIAAWQMTVLWRSTCRYYKSSLLDQ